MDGSDFDALTRSLTTASSRRRITGGLLGGALGLLGWHDQANEVLAKKGKGKKKKKRGGQRRTQSLSCPSGYTACGQQCVDLTDNTQHCGACFTVCSPGKVCCGGTCANLLDDDNHCGTCGHRCLTREEETPRINAAEICSNGTCVDCTTDGFIEDGEPTICCRGRVRCPASGALPPECIPAGQAC